MSGKLDGRIAVITGGARGQGASTAILFAAEGARVVIGDILEDEGRALAQQIGDAAMFVRLDVTSEDSWAALATAVAAKWGAPDTLVNNAGIVHAAGILDYEKKDFERVLSVNLIGSWLGIKTLAPAMIASGKGAIINISSLTGLIGGNGLAPYAASKWGLRSLSKTAAMELGPKGIRVNTVFPGGVNTPMTSETNKARTPASDAARKKYYDSHPLQRIGEPEEIACASLFLASDDASYISGAEIAVDGGLSAGMYTPFLPGSPG